MRGALRRARRRSNAMPLTVRFALVSGALVALLGTLLGYALSGIVHQRTESEARRFAGLTVNIALEPVLAGSLNGRGVRPDVVATLDREVRAGAQHEAVRGMRIFDVDGSLAYADTGRTPEDAADLAGVRAALAGQTTSTRTGAAPGPVGTQSGLVGLLDVFVPVFDGGSRPTGAVELYLPMDRVEQAATQDVRRLTLLLVAGLAVLWLALFRVVNRASRRLRAEVARNEHDARHDALTGLPNRVAATRRLAALLRRGSRGTAVLWVDLDGLKSINDSLGHPVGDQVLQGVSQRLTALVRAPDLVARFGGDEYVVVCADVGGPDGALALADRILAALRVPLSLPSGDHIVTASIGVALSDGATGADGLLAAADIAMYATKHRGRDGVALFDERMRASTVERLQLGSDLRGAAERGELRLHYQPQVDLRTGQVYGLEALVRWQHPQRGLLGPGSFIELAEETGVIVEVGQWVLQEACRALADWQHRARGAHRLGVSVNLAARQAGDPGVTQAVRSALERAGADPALLTLEITESAVMASVDTATATMHELRCTGVRLAIDDFGTGYSSLTYLQQFPVHELKIDKAFVDGVATDGQASAIVAAVVDLARAVGLHTVAEGVEDADQAAKLRALGADFGQGYLWHRPAPKDAVDRWLTERGALVAEPSGTAAAARLTAARP